MDALDAAKSLAQATGAVVAVTGAVDIITDGKQVIGAHNGIQMLQKITATGCSVTALIAAFVAIDPTHAFEATAAALSVFGIAGELGMETGLKPQRRSADSGNAALALLVLEGRDTLGAACQRV